MNDANASSDLCIINIIINANDLFSGSVVRCAAGVTEHISMSIIQRHEKRKQATRVFRLYDKFLNFEWMLRLVNVWTREHGTVATSNDDDDDDACFPI